MAKQAYVEAKTQDQWKAIAERERLHWINTVILVGTGLALGSIDIYVVGFLGGVLISAGILTGVFAWIERMKRRSRR